MPNLIRADWYKLRKSKAFVISCLLSFISALGMNLISYWIGQGQMAAELGSLTFSLSDLFILTLLGSFLAGSFICGDFEHRTIQDAISRGHSRFKVMLSKAIVYFIATAVMLLPYIVITSIAFSTGEKFSTPYAASVFLQILDNKSGIPFDAESLLKLIAVMLTLLTVYAARLSICILSSFVLKKSSLVVGIGFGGTMLLDQSLGLGNNLPSVAKLFSYTPFASGYTVVTLDASAGELFKATAVSLAFIALMLAVSYSAFRKSEMK